MAETNVLKVFEGSKVSLNYDGKNIQGKIMVSDGDSVVIEPFEISESELNDCWYGFTYKGKDFDMNVSLNDVENEETPVCIYPVINGTTVTTSDFVAIKKDSVFFEKQIAKEIINNNQMENKTMEAKTLTWDEIYRAAEGKAGVDWEVKVYDNARAYIAGYAKEHFGIDIEASEIPEDAIDDFLEKHPELNRFNESGQMLAEIDSENSHNVPDNKEAERRVDELKNIRVFENNPRKYFLDKYHSLQVVLLSEAEKESNYSDIMLKIRVDEMFQETSDIEAIVGYYIDKYGDNYYKQWQENISGKELTQSDKDLESLFQRVNAREKLLEKENKQNVEEKPFIPSEYVLNKLQEKGIEVVTDKSKFNELLKASEILQKMEGNKKENLSDKYFQANQSEAEAFSKELDAFIADYDKTQKTINPLKMLNVGSISPVMKLLGIADVPVGIDQSTISKALREEPIYPDDKQGHKLTIDELKNIPQSLADPVMVFRSDSPTRRQRDSYVFFTERRDFKNRSIIIPVAVNKKYGRLVINKVTSIYGRKEEIQYVKDNIQKGNLVYFDKKRSLEWERECKVQFLAQVLPIEGSINNILSKDSLVKFLDSKSEKMVKDGTTYGFAHNGKIYLNSDVLSAESAMHEYTHLWDNLTRKDNPMLWNKGLEIFKSTSLWNEVINDEHYQDIKDDENLVLSECHARITGKVAETVLNRIAELDGNEKQAEMIDWDKEIVEFIFENYRDVFEKNSFSSVAEFTTATMKDLFSPVEQQKQDIAIDSSAFERMEKFFEGKFCDDFKKGDSFAQLYESVKEEFPNQNTLLEAVSRMVYSNVNFGDLEPASYDDVYGFGDGAEQRFDVSDDIAKRLINNEISPDWLTIQNEVNDFACRRLMDLKENNPDMLLTDTINEAFEISKKYNPLAEKNINAYTKSEKTQNIRKALENIKKTYTEDSHDIRIDYGTGIFGADLEALIKGNDAAIYGEKSLDFVRPDRISLELGIEDDIPFNDLIRGYFVFDSEDLKVPRHIERWDYMEVFDTDYDAAQQWKLETGGKLLENGKDIWISDENLEHLYYPDTPENRVALKEYLLPQPLEFNWDNFTEEQFNAVKEEITSGNIKEDYKGQVYVGSVCVEFTITDKESCWVDYNNYILGEKGEGEISGIPYSYQNGKQVVMNTFTENTYENFKTVIENVLIEDLGKDSHLKQEAMRKTINWSTINENNKEAALQLWKEKEGRNMENTFENLSNEETMKYLKDYFNEKNVSISDDLAEEMFYKHLDNGFELKKTKNDLYFYTVDEETGKTEYVSTHKIVDNVFNWDEKELSELHSGTADVKDIESLKGFVSQLETIKTHFHRIFETFPPVDFKISDFTGISTANSKNEKQISFIDDEEKMKDFPKLSKEEFLSSYSYLSEEEYDATVKDYSELNQSAVPSHFSDTVKTVEDINKVYDKNLDFIEQNISFKYSNPEYNEIDEIEKWKKGELYIPVADKNGNFTNDMEANTLADYNLYANKNFKSYSEVVEYQAGLKAKLLDSAIENCITEYLRREYAETSPYSAKFEVTVENQSYPIDKEGLDYIADTNEWGSANDRLNEVIDRRFEEEIEQKEIDIVSDILEYISQETNGNLVLKNNEISNVLFSDELVQIYAPKEEFLAIQPEETKAALIEAGIAKEDLYKNVETMTVSEKARDEMLSANFAGHGGLTQKAFADNGIEIDLETANALENCFSQIEAITKYTADGHDLFSKGNGIDTISEHSIEYSEETKSWFIHEKNWIALSAIKGDKAGPDDYMEKADRVGDRNWSIGCELLVKYVYQEIKEDGEMEKEFPDTFKKLENLKDYTESLTEAKQLISDFCFDEYMSTPTFDNLKDVGLAYTTFEDPYTHEEYEIQTSADLINNKITTKVNDKIADSMEYDSLKDMVVNRLNNLDFDSLIYVPSSKLDELLKEKRESVENTLLEKADQIIAETFNEPSFAKRAKLYVPSDYGYDADNKIHILVEFDNKAEREDDLFNALAEQHFVLPNGREVDFNPIKPEKSGTIEQYLDSLERIKENRFQRRKEDKLGKVVVSKENFRDVFSEVIKLPKYKNKPLEAAGFCFSRVPTENKAEVAQWFSNLGCKTKNDTNNLFNKWNKENNPKPNVNKSKSREVDDWSISD